MGKKGKFNNHSCFKINLDSNSVPLLDLESPIGCCHLVGQKYAKTDFYFREDIYFHNFWDKLFETFGKKRGEYPKDMTEFKDYSTIS